jgi:hypothetical protein
MAAKDRWNATDPRDDKEFRPYVTRPELAGLLPVLYPGVFPKLAAYTKPRADLGRDPAHRDPGPASCPGFQNFTGPVQADLLRLNLAIPPTPAPKVPRADRRRPGRLPERPPAARRRGHHRAAGGRRERRSRWSTPRSRPDARPPR